MDNHSKKVSEMVRSGAYYAESRAWYQTKYIGPVSERTFFLIVALLAGLVALASFIAVGRFLPLVERRPILVANSRIDDAVPRLVPMRTVKGMPINESIERFMVSSYVENREGYDSMTYNDSYNFVKGQSDAATFKAYDATYGRDNKQSLANVLNTVGKRLVTIDSVNISGNNPSTAVVQFSTDVLGYSEPLHADWTATLQFYYSELVVKNSIDPKTHEPLITTQDPQFQVVHYDLKQTP